MAVYWFKVGSQLTPSYWNQQLMIAWHYLTGKPVSSAMVRISSVFSKRGDPEQAENIIKDFAAIITPELFKYLP